VNAIVLSDHGMKPIHHVFHVNRWLELHGHLRFRRRSAQRVRGFARLDSHLALRHRWYRACSTGWCRSVPPATANRTMRDIDRWHTTLTPTAPAAHLPRRGDRAAGDTVFRDRLIEGSRGNRVPWTARRPSSCSPAIRCIVGVSRAKRRTS
jgi:hypothetical protein